jgi:hypothetical protein
MISFLKKIYATPSAHELAVRELEEARRSLLAAQTERDHANALVDYHQARIDRLDAYVKAAAVQQ